MKLYYFIVGCKPPGRLTEQHDVFFCIANDLKECLPLLNEFWPGANLHIDSYSIINTVIGYDIQIVPRSSSANNQKLFFINLGAYVPGQMEEFHYKALCVADSRKKAVSFIKKNADFSHLSKEVFQLHTDDSYGFDVDDIFEIEDALPKEQQEKYSIQLIKNDTELTNFDMHIGYLPLKDVK